MCAKYNFCSLPFLISTFQHHYHLLPITRCWTGTSQPAQNYYKRAITLFWPQASSPTTLAGAYVRSTTFCRSHVGFHWRHAFCLYCTVQGMCLKGGGEMYEAKACFALTLPPQTDYTLVATSDAAAAFVCVTFHAVVL